jgi:hypothetical protein
MRRIFVGSSTEAEPIANGLIKRLNAQPETRADSWREVFPLASITLLSLEEAVSKYSYAVFVFSADDAVEVRGKKLKIPRDNVIFEAGLFMKACGKERTFIVKPDDPHVLSDLAGFTYAGMRLSPDPKIQRKSLAETCSAILKRIGELEVPTANASAFVGNWNGYMRQVVTNPPEKELPVSANFKAIGNVVSAELEIGVPRDMYKPGKLQLWLSGTFYPNSLALRCDYGYRNFWTSAQAGAIILSIDGTETKITGTFAGYGPITEEFVHGTFFLESQDRRRPLSPL